MSEAGWSGQDQPFVAVDRQGDSLLAWAGCDSNASGCYDQVKARTASADGVLGPVQTLTPLGASASWPKVASDDDGDSAVVWTQDGLVAGRRVSATGEPGPLQMIATWHGVSPAVAVDPSGLALVTWTEIRDGAYTTKARYFGAVGPDGTFGAAEVLSPDGRYAQPASSPTGRFSVIWQKGSYQYDIRARFGQ